MLQTTEHKRNKRLDLVQLQSRPLWDQDLVVLEKDPRNEDTRQPASTLEPPIERLNSQTKPLNKYGPIRPLKNPIELAKESKTPFKKPFYSPVEPLR